MVRSLAVVTAVFLGLGCSGDKLCPAGSEMKDGVCRIASPVGDLDLVLPMPADVNSEAKDDVAADVVPADGTLPQDSATETQPTDMMEMLPTDAVETQPADATEMLPADAVETQPADATDMLPADAVETLPADTTEMIPEVDATEPSPETTATEVLNE